MQEETQLLLFLAGKAGLSGQLKISTAAIASELGMSQQTASRKLRQLAKKGMIDLSATPTGCVLSLTPKGAEILGQQYSQLKQLFAAGGKARLVGTVKRGIGEGRYYVSRKQYLQQFKKQLGFTPFFGTLNLVVKPQELHSFLAAERPIEIRGFATKQRAFGPIRAFRVLVNGKEPAAIVFPERGLRRENEIEVISAIDLRKRFRLRDGKKATVSK